MRINKIRLLNIASYKGKHEIDFNTPILRDAGIFLISGNTGSGKSTILDSITLALYAKVYRLGKNISDVISKGSIKASVELTFTVSSKVYESFVELNIGNKETPRSMRLKSCSEDLVVEGKDDVIKYIENLCRLDFKQFCQTVILPQGNFEEFLISSPKDKTKVLNNIFNLEKYDNLDSYIQKELSLTNLDKEILNSDFRNLNNNFIEDMAKLENLENYLKSLKIDESKKYTKNLKKLIEIIEASVKTKDEFSKLEKNLSRLNLELVESKEKIYSLTKSYELKLKLKNNLEKDLHIYRSEEFINLKNVIGRENENLKEQNSIESQITSLGAELSKFEALASSGFNFDYIKELYLQNLNIRQHVFEPHKYNLLLKALAELEKENNELLAMQHQKNTEIKQNSLNSSDFNFDNYVYYKSLGMFLNFTEEMYIKYKRVLEELEDNEANKVKIEIYSKLLEDFGLKKTQISDEMQILSGLESKYKAHRDTEKLKTKNIDEVLKLNEKIQNLQSKILDAQNELKEKEKEKLESSIENERFTKNNKEIMTRIGEPLFKKYIDYRDVHKLYEFESKIKEIESLKSKLDKLRLKRDLKKGESEKNLLLVKNLTLHLNLVFKFETYEKFSKDYHRMLRKYMELEEEFKKLSVFLDELKTKKIELESRVKFVKNETFKLEQIKEKENKLLVQSLVNLRIFLSNDIKDKDLVEHFEHSADLTVFKTKVILKLELSAKLISEYEVNLKNFNVLKQEIEKDKLKLQELRLKVQEISERFEKLEVIKKVVSGSFGLKYYVQKFLLQEIVNLANTRYLKYIFKDFKLKVNTESKEFDFLIESRIGESNTRTVKTLSGGEKFLVSLSLSLALSDMIRDSKLQIEAFFLDEGFGNLDEHTLRLVIPKLSEFQKTNGRQIGIISHVSYLKDIITTQIVVNKVSRISSISIENS